jgi:regulator of protease activity HflC (stomatin/prohibitin superfamily)
MPRFPSINKAGIAVVLVIFVVILVLSIKSVATIQAGYRGIVLHLGAVENRVLGEGLHFVTPFAEQVVQMEVRTQKFQADSSAASKDLQEVRTTIALNYRIDPQQANKIYQLLGINYQDRIIDPTIQESVKASVAKFNAEELITRRQTAKDAIAQTIRATLSSNNIIVQNVFITDFQFSRSFSDQIEQKVVAFQKFLTEQNNLRAVKVVANQTVAQAEGQARATAARANGESQAIQLITQQLKESPQYLQWQAITKWNGQMPYALGSSGFPFFQLPTANIHNFTKS